MTTLNTAQLVIFKAINRFRERCQIRLTFRQYWQIVERIRSGHAPVVGFNIRQQNIYRVTLEGGLVIHAAWDDKFHYVSHLFGPPPISQRNRPMSAAGQLFCVRPPISLSQQEAHHG